MQRTARQLIESEAASVSVKVLPPNSPYADGVDAVFSQAGIFVSAVRQPLIAAFHGDEVIGGIMANLNGDMMIDVAVAKEHRGQGVGRALLQKAIQYYTKYSERLAEQSGVDVEDYSLIVLPISSRMEPLLQSLGFTREGEEFVYARKLPRSS